MTSTLNVSKIEPLSGSGTMHVGSDSSNTITINTTTKAVTMLGNLNVSGVLTGTGNSVLTTTSSNFKLADLTTNAFYRAGTWTPILSDSTASSAGATVHTGTPQIQQGHYVRIGDFVNLNWVYQTPSTSFSYTNGSSGAGRLQWHGLPFKIGAQANNQPVCVCGYFDNWTGWVQGYTPMGHGKENTNHTEHYYADTDGVTNLVSARHSAVNSISYWSMNYITDDA